MSGFIKRLKHVVAGSGKESADVLVEQVTQIRKTHNVLAITGKPEEHSWRGVYNASLNFFPENLLAIDHQFSKNIYSEKELEYICRAIAESRFKKVIFSGYSDCVRVLIQKLHELKASPPLLLIYHGSLSQHADNYADAVYLKEVLWLSQEKIIHRIGFIKKGLSETLNKILNIHSHFLINIGNENETVKTESISGLHVGVFTHNSFRKNLHNQVAAALMLDQATVHVHDTGDFEYLNSASRLRAHPFTESYDDFLKVLGSMSLNFYVTFSECYGLVIAESLSLGVPCLASNSSGFFDYDELLRTSLVVAEYDNSEAIFRKAQEVLSNREAIAARGKEYVKKLNAIARGKLHDFLNS
jgi:glycosyltransferase involved in cell wall biosynthesis